MKLSVVITTRNEADNIESCIRPFDDFRDDVEVVVVDNGSTDETKEIAARLGAKVFDKGPERSAQRNFGWRISSAQWVIILDADMILPPETVEEVLQVASSPLKEGGVAAYWIPEVRTGKGIRVKARNFERSFYNGTCVDALRLFNVSVLEETGGYDENLIAGPEDWDLDMRVLAAGAKCEVLKNHLIHNEKRLSFKRMLEKKAYYSKSMGVYSAKWKGSEVLKKQLGFKYRYFTVFIENGRWRKLLKHPILASVMYFERIAVGVVYLLNRSK